MMEKIDLWKWLDETENKVKDHIEAYLKDASLDKMLEQASEIISENLPVYYYQINNLYADFATTLRTNAHDFTIEGETVQEHVQRIVYDGMYTMAYNRIVSFIENNYTKKF